uniref:N-acetyltransferase domain-containing protein n=1 Tax=Parascaris equorum TaxID=6256 RepID=A0A914S6V9_PAREQ
MEDLYVRPEYRQQGIGQRLWVQVAKVRFKAFVNNETSVADKFPNIKCYTGGV